MSDREKQDREDMQFLNGRPEFRRFVLRVIQQAKIFASATDGSKDRHLAFDEGRRSLGLDILAMAETGQPVTHAEGLPILTIMQVFREEADKPQEKKIAKPRSRYDELNESDD